MRIQLDGKCDQTRYPVALTDTQVIAAVEYRDQELPRRRISGGYIVPKNSSFTLVGNPPDLIPDSEIAAFWYTRACYEQKRLPMFYYFKPAQRLIVFPPVANSGDKIIVTIRDVPPPLPDDDLDTNGEYPTP